MTRYSFRSSQPDSWVAPRPYSDPNLRMRKYGRIQPMEGPGLFQRLLRAV
ncbi:hypothetical protein ACRAQ6_12620 [Erythrobacter sp. HA6-11]